MMHYYIFAKEDELESVLEELSEISSNLITSIIVKDNSGFMPSRYIRVCTDVLTDVGLVETLKLHTLLFVKNKVKLLKELTQQVVLV